MIEHKKGCREQTINQELESMRDSNGRTDYVERRAPARIVYDFAHITITSGSRAVEVC